MDNFKVQALIAQGDLVKAADIDASKSYLQIGVFQEGNRQNGPGNPNAYAPYAIALSEVGGTTGKYRISDFPETVIPKTDFNETTMGKAFDAGVVPSYARYCAYLNNGNIVEVPYCLSKLESGIFIFEAYDLQGTYPTGNNGYWFAYKQDPTNPERLIKVGECPMTTSFYEKGYDWTAKDSGPNVVKFVFATQPNTDSATLLSVINKLTWTGSSLVVEEIFFDYGGATVLSLYNDLTGYNLQPGDAGWNYRQPEYIVDDDFYGMNMGKEKGWYWYRNVSGGGDSPVPDGVWTLVGFNILTGATKVTYINNTVLSSITNINFDPSILFKTALIAGWYNHPDGITISLFDGYSPDDGDNYKGVTALWSPYWNNSTEAIYITIRDEYSCNRVSTFGDLTKTPFYWDNKAWYFFANNVNFISRDCIWKVHKYHVDTRKTTVYTLPFIAPIPEATLNISTDPGLWPNNDGLFIYYAVFFTTNDYPSWGMTVWQYLKHADNKCYGFHLDFRYPTHAFEDKITSIGTRASYSFDTLGVAISTYKNMTF